MKMSIQNKMKYKAITFMSYKAAEAGKKFVMVNSVLQQRYVLGLGLQSLGLTLEAPGFIRGE